MLVQNMSSSEFPGRNDERLQEVAIAFIDNLSIIFIPTALT
jgi:hypothetical protein